MIFKAGTIFDIDESSSGVLNEFAGVANLRLLCTDVQRTQKLFVSRLP